MAEFWFSALAFTLIAYAVLDGFDFGAGALGSFLARTEAEQSAVIAAIGPFWDGNEVWLIAAGGVLFLAFPSVLAAAFPAFYLALFLVLWCLILRGVAIEVRGHFADPMWRSFWGVVFAASSALLALLFGVALGNLVRGFPIGDRPEFTLAFFTHFGVRGDVGLLDYYTLSVGALTVVALFAHGAAFLAYRTGGALRERARRLERRLWLLGALLFVLVSLETFSVRPQFFAALAGRPLAWLFTALAASGAVLGALAHASGRDLGVFVGSTALLGGLLSTTAVGLYPTLLHSTIDPRFSITVERSLSAAYGLRIGLLWWPVALLLALTYVGFAFRANRGKVNTDV